MTKKRVSAVQTAIFLVGLLVLSLASAQQRIISEKGMNSNDLSDKQLEEDFLNAIEKNNEEENTDEQKVITESDSNQSQSSSDDSSNDAASQSNSEEKKEKEDNDGDDEEKGKQSNNDDKTSKEQEDSTSKKDIQASKVEEEEQTQEKQEKKTDKKKKKVDGDKQQESKEHKKKDKNKKKVKNEDENEDKSEEEDSEEERGEDEEQFAGKVGDKTTASVGQIKDQILGLGDNIAEGFSDAFKLEQPTTVSSSSSEESTTGEDSTKTSTDKETTTTDNEDTSEASSESKKAKKKGTKKSSQEEKNKDSKKGKETDVEEKKKFLLPQISEAIHGIFKIDPKYQEKDNTLVKQIQSAAEQLSSHQKNRMKQLTETDAENQMVSEFYFDSEHPVKSSDGKEIEGESNRNQLNAPSIGEVVGTNAQKLSHELSEGMEDIKNSILDPKVIFENTDELRKKAINAPEEVKEVVEDSVDAVSQVKDTAESVGEAAKEAVTAEKKNKLNQNQQNEGISQKGSQQQQDTKGEAISLIQEKVNRNTKVAPCVAILLKKNGKDKLTKNSYSDCGCGGTYKPPPMPSRLF